MIQKHRAGLGFSALVYETKSIWASKWQRAIVILKKHVLVFLLYSKYAALSSHTHLISCKVITVPSVQTVTSWSSTECPTACSPPVPVTSVTKWKKMNQKKKKNNTESFPYGKRGWAVPEKKDSHPFSASPKAWSSFHTPPHHKVWLGFSLLPFHSGGTQNIPKSSTHLPFSELKTKQQGLLVTHLLEKPFLDVIF